jgi:uncharacterized membrane protein
MKKMILYLDKLNHSYRVLLALLVGVITFVSSQCVHHQSIAALYSWIAFCFISLVFAWVTILAKHPINTGIIASEQDNGYWLMLLIILIAAVTSLFAILYLLQTIPDGNKKGFGMQLFQSIVALFFSWLLIHTLFVFKYADMYYTPTSGIDIETNNYKGGLNFPDTEQPDFFDFAYFSFGLGMTFQVADVNVTNARFRKIILVHSFISYVYSSAIIAIGINIISGLIGK